MALYDIFIRAPVAAVEKAAVERHPDGHSAHWQASRLGPFEARLEESQWRVALVGVGCVVGHGVREIHAVPTGHPRPAEEPVVEEQSLLPPVGVVGQRDRPRKLGVILLLLVTT